MQNKRRTTQKIMRYELFMLGIIILLGLAVSAQGVDAYVLLEPIVEIDNPGEDLEGYFEALYKLVVGLAAALAVVMLVIGGVQYMAARDNPQALGEAQGRIWAAIGGLILVLLSWIILNTINPDLLEFKLDLDSVGSGSSQTPSSGGGSPSNITVCTASGICR